MARFLTLALVFIVLAAPLAAERRGAFVLEPADGSGAIELYLKSYALVIGNDAYSDGWPRLANAVSDARAVAAALEQSGFEVTLATDLNAGDLERTVEDFIYDNGVDEAARLLIWYAGHGHMIGDEAYLVPIDAPRPEARSKFLRRALSMRDFGKFMRQVEARHVLAIFDSCFSGNVFDMTRAAPSPAVTGAIGLPVRQLITAGQAGQTVSDDGTFRKLFVDALNGDEPFADANRDGYLTGSELGLFLSDKVTSLTLNRQTPRYGKLRARGFDRGDFVFRVAGAVPGAAVAAGTVAPSVVAPAFLQPTTPQPSFLQPAVQAPTVAEPEASLPAETTETRFVMEGNQSVVMMDGRLLFSMTRTPTGGRIDLVGLRVNGINEAIGIGGNIVANGPDDGCVLTLMQIFEGENRAEFLMRCGKPSGVKLRAPAAMTTELTDAPRVIEAFTMQGGASHILGPNRTIFAMRGTPTGGRSDLVGVISDGLNKALGIGDIMKAGDGQQECTIAVTKIHIGQNQADFLLRCP